MLEFIFKSQIQKFNTIRNLKALMSAFRVGSVVGVAFEMMGQINRSFFR